eukprot:5027293-Amphidinium_carterae.3
MADAQDTRSTLPIAVNSSTDPNSLETLSVPRLHGASLIHRDDEGNTGSTALPAEAPEALVIPVPPKSMPAQGARVRRDAEEMAPPPSTLRSYITTAMGSLATRRSMLPDFTSRKSSLSTDGSSSDVAQTPRQHIQQDSTSMGYTEGGSTEGDTVSEEVSLQQDQSCSVQPA